MKKKDGQVVGEWAGVMVLCSLNADRLSALESAGVTIAADMQNYHARSIRARYGTCGQALKKKLRVSLTYHQ